MALSWTTEHELSFITHLGTYREGHKITPMRLALLTNYVQAARTRRHWGTLDSATVIRYAEAQLAEEQRKAGHDVY
jgi:hypothetical protein